MVQADWIERLVQKATIKAYLALSPFNIFLESDASSIYLRITEFGFSGDIRRFA